MKTTELVRIVVSALLVGALPLSAVAAGAPRAAGLVLRAQDLDPADLAPVPDPAFDDVSAGPRRPGAGGIAPGSALERVRALKAERASAPASRIATAAVRTVEVDCTRGKSVQRAVERNASPLIVEIHGICEENVRIEGQQVTLRGTDPATDGIRGVAADPAPIAALEIYYSDAVAIENLSISDGPAIGLGIWFSQVSMDNVRVEDNGSTGVHASVGGFVDGFEVSASGNGGFGVNAQRGAIVFCTGCVVEDNASFAANATFGAVLTLLDSTVSGARGLRSAVGSYADIDCVSSTATSYPCGLDATAVAGFSIQDATVAFFGAGDFAGAFLGFDRSHVYFLGARQLDTGTTPGGDPRVNLLGQHATLTAEPFIDENNVAHESRLAGQTQVDGFSRALLTSETVVDGTLTCASAGDAWADPGVTVTSGGGIVDCEHAALP